MKQQNSAKTLLWITFFAIAMGYLETAVVVYIREIYYPDGFQFPMRLIGYDIAVTEFFREIATVIMLIGAGIMAGRTALERFAYFIYSFAVWDIFYYVFLKLLLNWPDSLMTWDVLFLIPVTWIGPVIGPVVNSIMMIILALAIVYFTNLLERVKMGKIEWALLIIGSVIVIMAYTEEYTQFMMQYFSFGQLLDYSNANDVMRHATQYIPQVFKWWIYFTGIGMHFVAIGMFIYKNFRLYRQQKLGNSRK